MNTDNLTNQENEPVETVTKPTPPTRSYKRREPKAPTIASLNEQIEAKKLQIEGIQAEIETLTKKRNGLYFDESEVLGLIEIMADPDKAKWLAEKLNEYKHKR